MTQDQTADLLKRAAIRLSNSYLVEVENERDSRWDGDLDKARMHRDEAEETRTLIRQCRAAAERLSCDRGSSAVRNRGRRAGKSLIPSPPA